MDAGSMRRSVWVSSIIALAGMALYIGIAAALGLVWTPGSGLGLAILGMFLALVPALIWMVFFYQRDRVEPEPKQLVARMFVFGAVGAGIAIPLAQPIVGGIIPQLPSLILRLLVTILTVSLLQETLKVAMVRYVVLGTDEFDRHPDGIVYGLASGLGFATVLTLHFALGSSDAVEPLKLAIRAVDNALVHGVLGAVSGYYIGRVKIDGKKLGWMIRGLAIVTVINGIYRVAANEFSATFTFNPWYSLLIALGLAIVVGAVLFAVFRRAILRATGALSTVSIQIHARSPQLIWDIHPRYDLLLIGALVLALGIGWGLLGGLDARHLTYTGDEISASFQYPTGWGIQTQATGEVTLRNPFAPGAFKPTLTVSETKTAAATSLDFIMGELVTGYEQTKTLFVEISREPMTVDDHEAIQLEYRYACEIGGSPVVVYGAETYVLIENQLYIFRYEAEPDAFETGLAHYERLLESVRFRASS